jgi:hypothetical protein
VQVRFVDGTRISDWSATTEIKTPDRTAPEFVSSVPAAGATGIIPDSQVNIAWSDADIDLYDVSWNKSTVIINNQTLSPAAPIPPTSSLGIIVSGEAYFNPSGQKYNQMVTVSVLLKDQADNFMNSPHIFTYRTAMAAPDTPAVVWNPSPPNSRYEQSITVSPPNTANAGGKGIDNIAGYAVQFRKQGGEWLYPEFYLLSDSASPNVEDNSMIEVRVHFIDSAYEEDLLLLQEMNIEFEDEDEYEKYLELILALSESLFETGWSSLQTVKIGDRTPPSVYKYQFGDVEVTAENIWYWLPNAPRIMPNTPLTIFATDTDIEGKGIKEK